MKYFLFFLFPALLTADIQEVTISADVVSPLAVGNRMTSTTIVTEEEIRAKQYRSVVEAVADVPGVSALPAGYGQTVSLFIRGQKSEQTLILVDGVEYNDPTDPGRGADLSHLTLENVERIEVIRGAQSVLYPGVGSVVQIITKTGRTSSQRLSVEAGSFGTYKGNLHASGATQTGFDYALSTGLFHTEGFSVADGKPETDGARTITFSGKFGKKLGEATRADLVLRYVDGKSDLDLVPADTQNFKMSQQSWMGRFQVKTRRGNWEPVLGVNVRLVDRQSLDYGSTPNTRFLANGSILKSDFVNRYFLAAEHMMTLGFEIERQRSDMESDQGTGVKRADRSVTQSAAYLQYDWMRDSGPYMTAGTRFDYHSAFYGKLTARAAPGWRIAETGTTFRSGVGTGFKAPSIYQLYGEFGNPYLKSEQALLLDIGIEQVVLPNRFTVIATAFWNNLTDMVDFDIPNNRYISIGKATSKGIEGSLEYRPLFWLKIASQYTFLETRDDVTGLKLLRRPKHRLANTITLLKGDGEAALTHELVGGRDDVDATTFARKAMPSYHLFHFAGSYQVMEGTRLTLRVDNLFDTRYQAVDGYGTAGLSAYIGVRQEL